MKKHFLKRNNTLFFGLALCTAFVTSCSSDDSSKLGNWITGTVFDGAPRSSAVSFMIGDYGYAGTGYDGDYYLNDFWQYDINGGYWVQKADFPGEGRSSAVGFSVNNAGYIGTGYNGTDELGDFYEYNPSDNSWEQIADFGGTTRRAAVGFGSATSGYVGSGFDGDNDKKDFWKYNPSTDTWEEMFGFGGNKRREGVTFTIGTNVYFGTGSSNGLNVDDFWVFDTNTETWTKLKDLDDDDNYTVERSNAVGFSIGSYGYIAGGDANSVWEYDPANDDWDEKTNFEGTPRQDGAAFNTDSRAFIFLGKYGNYYFDDMYEFRPFEEYDDED
ncbi:galactose oxidase [Flavobacterium arcticum]|uniref:Galactose oxidase n=1 Tax=Flavobacterium arcticum TaxID=1784713 RepID=A0A345H9Q1_9FLAO|nr:kelch repeat-containing protein [Flavobacterium arcticum]AXG73311.1 galactose oxidase [Flavobacterium arcticum]KAF2513106.1 galactose oxidase [Flavobacterium arcticum]